MGEGREVAELHLNRFISLISAPLRREYTPTLLFSTFFWSAMVQPFSTIGFFEPHYVWCLVLRSAVAPRTERKDRVLQHTLSPGEQKFFRFVTFFLAFIG